MEKRNKPRIIQDGPPFVHVGEHVARIPSIASAVRLLAVVAHVDTLITRKREAPPAEHPALNSGIVAGCAFVVGATWSAPGADLTTPRILGEWRTVDTGVPVAVEEWGDAVAEELIRGGWSPQRIGDVYAEIAPALVDVCHVDVPAVEARAGFSDAPKAP